ncbi:conserved hypothetical protein [Deferribacter desulfuricans SSM1]|uniref:Radical SAM core domain-containing protein n=1 Tax=Deferribacter desulfuricans (strain DSM 14783 / JCM 11476 / NBRC 101012 / SSM1) TaxID=639282 RepID=D3PAP5_DEFDS|nr:radical SAM protein [Deferribacter desulfuricans]BAI79668.1 conserved hypothetical protein [Deferribacter desulfuricans SSM1]
MKNGKDILPVFIPFAGCPKKCIYCQQNSITGVKLHDFKKDVEDQVNLFLRVKKKWGKIAFYGGSFNLLPKDKREFLYKVANSINILKVRVSCYPSGFDTELINEMKDNNVEDVELGVQSFSEKVLRLNGRDYSSNEVVKILKLLKQNNFNVGIQIMVGMFGEEYGDIIQNIDFIDKLKFEYIRIYPAVIFKDTKLAALIKSGKNLNYGFSEIIAITTFYYILAIKKGVTVLRIGLHNSSGIERFIEGGYFHPSFGDVVKTFMIYIYLKLFKKSKLYKNYPNYGGVIAKIFNVSYDEKIDINSIAYKLWSEYFENNWWGIKGEIFDLAQEFWSKANK